MMDDVEFADLSDNRDEIVKVISFPLSMALQDSICKDIQESCFTEKGQRQYIISFREYMPEVLKEMSDKNIYSFLVYLYHSFYSQGSMLIPQSMLWNSITINCAYPLMTFV